VHSQLGCRWKDKKTVDVKHGIRLGEAVRHVSAPYEALVEEFSQSSEAALLESVREAGNREEKVRTDHDGQLPPGVRPGSL
jgi:hypothetical protein